MIAILIISAVIILDQLTKYLVVQNIMGKADFVVISNFFNITYVENFGIAFGMFKNNTVFFIITTSVIALVVSYFLIRIHKRNLLGTICLSLIVGGAIGNLIDRIRLGFVVDFLHFSIFPPVFNIADSAIVLGALTLSAYILLKKDFEL